MNDFLILLKYFLSEFLFLFIAITILFLFVQFLEEFNLCVELLYYILFIFNFIFERINFITIQILAFISKLIHLFSKNAILFDLIFKLFFHYLQSRINTFLILLFWFLLHLLQNWVQLLVQLFELLFQSVVLPFLLLNQLQPQLIDKYISATLPWYFFIIRFTPYFD